MKTCMGKDGNGCIENYPCDICTGGVERNINSGLTGTFEIFNSVADVYGNRGFLFP